MRFDTRRGLGILVQYLSQGVVEVGHQWTAVRMYIVAPSEWGQQACDKLLGIARASDLHVTLIVPRRDELAFKSWPIGAWKGEYKSVRHACDELAKKGHPISYMYDDFLDAIRAQMLRERNEGYGVILYVTSNADKHIDYAKSFNGYAHRILIEKPYSAFYDDFYGADEKLLQPAGDTQIVTAEHYLFRPGVTAAWIGSPATAGSAWCWP